MKRFTIATFMMLFVMLTTYAQTTQRLVLLEHFTQASCGPCAAANPGLQLKLDFNEDKIIAIKNQVSWPGYDPMYNHNPIQIAARSTYYGVTGVPHSHMDGSFWDDHPNSVTLTLINSRYAVPSPFLVTLSHTKSANDDTVFVNMKIKAEQMVTGSLVAHIAVLENHIHFASAPGSNGETDFYNVMKRMLPSEFGTALPDTMNPGDSVVITESWAFANVYDPVQIAVVGFIQDNSNKAVHQAAYSPPIGPEYNDVSIEEIISPPDITCNNVVVPQILIKNQGQVLNDVDVIYSINGGTADTVHWTGNLRFLGKAMIQLDTVTFTMQPANTFEVYLSNPNGGVDSIPANDSASKQFDKAYLATHVVHLEIKTDNYPDETTWKLFNSAGVQVYSGGPYTQANHVYNATFNLSANDCYNFEIYDAYGDGICCSYGNGYYKLSDINNVVFKNGGNFASAEATPFLADVTTSIEEAAPEVSLSIYPNPARNTTSVDLMLPATSVVNLGLYDMFGNRIYDVEERNISAGQHVINIDVQAFTPGMYLLRAEINGELITRKITIVK